MGYVVLHLDKSPDNEVPMTAHIARTKMPPNAIPELTYLNEELVEYPEGVADRTEAINHRLEHAGLTRKIGTNQVRVIRVMLTGTQEDMKRIAQEGRLKAWCADNLAWLRKTFGTENVVSAVLHMDEATPHLHIDFVPFITGSKRGLDTRVSLKQALAAQGFKGGTRENTEWNQWIQSEKEQLSAVMERHGIEWEHKGTHEKHLSVIDYKKQEREKEVARLGDEISKQEDKLELVKSRINNMLDCEKSLDNVVKNFDKDPQYQLPDPPALMSAKTYKTKIAQPIINALRELVQGVIIKYFEMKNTLEQWRQANQSLYHDNNRLSEKAKNLENINAKQKAELQDYKLLRKVFGNKQIDDMLKQAKEITQSKQRGSRFRNYKDER